VSAPISDAPFDRDRNLPESPVDAGTPFAGS
jgi:hypothetical protein